MPAGDQPGVVSHKPPLVGRTDELTRLSDVSDLAVEHGAQVVLLSGDAGIGKSTLTSELLRQLEAAGWGCYLGHCIEYADRPLPFGAVVTVLRELLLDNLENLEDSGGILGAHRSDLSTLIPELGADRENRSSLTGDVDRLFDAVTSTLIAASRRRPIAVVVEDVHWADAATRDVLASLVPNLGSARVLLIVTERSGALERSHPLRTWLAEQRRFANVHSVELEGLSQDELADQAEGILGEPLESRALDDLLERTEGNPYFARELLIANRKGAETLPNSLVAFLTSRIEQRSDDERSLLRAMAVAGRTVRHEMLASMAPDLDVSGIVRSLFDASILTVDGDNYAFGHGLLREAILDDVLPFEAQQLHRRAAEAMLEQREPQARSLSTVVSLALHWGQADDPERSVNSAVEAAQAAAVVAAYDTAADMALQALTHWASATNPTELAGMERDQLVVQCADWLISCHRGAEAVELIGDVLASWASETTDSRRALLLATMAPIEYNVGNPSHAAELLVEAERLVGDDVSPEAAQVHHGVSKQAVADGNIHPALHAAERAIAIADRVGPRAVLIEALTTKALAIGVTGNLEAGLSLAAEARELALADGMVSQVARTYRNEMLIINFRDGRTEACLAALVQGLAYAEENCGPRWRADFRHDLSLGYVEAGRLTDAAPLLERLLGSELEGLMSLWVLQTATLHALAAGTLDAAGRFLDDADELAARYESAQETGVQARLRAELCRRQGSFSDALALIDRALELQLASDNLTYTRESIVEKSRIVRALVESGDDATEAVMAGLASLIDDFAGTGPANISMKSLMTLELAAANGNVDLDAVTATIELLESAGFHYEAAQARLLAVEHLLLAGREARSELGERVPELFDIASSHGMAWIVDRTVALAKALRIPIAKMPEPPGSRDKAESLPHQLTAREVEVMALLAEGMTNKAIGAQLYVSPRTVSTHISNLLAKLGVGNRGEAAAAYHRLGLEAIIDLREVSESSS